MLSGLRNFHRLPAGTSPFPGLIARAKAMIELVFIVCLSAAPATCKQHAMQFADLTIMTCASAAQPQLAQWAANHPDWRIRRWTCQPLREERDI